MGALKSLFLLSTLTFLASCSLFSNQLNSTVDELIITPDPNGHQKIIEGILDARKTIWMKMYHLSNPAVVDALIKAHQNKVDIKIILDSASLQSKNFRVVFDQLRDAGINVRASSPCFSITHEKSLIIDSKKAFITAINLTKNYAETRDFGIITKRQDIIDEMKEVYMADWQNAAANTCKTPTLKVANLLWSPVNAEDKLVDLIRTARYNINLSVENLGNKKIEDALKEMTTQGVSIKVLLPQCDKNKNPLYNYPFINILARSNVEVKVMPYPASKEHPYMHSKMILIDDELAYIGSINFSNNSILKSRELGIIFPDEQAIKKISEEFKKDWSVSIAPVSLAPGYCPELD